MPLSTVPAVFGAACAEQAGRHAAAARFRRVLLVSDPGVVAAGHAGRVAEALRAEGLHVAIFDRVRENPTTAHVADGLAAAQAERCDALVAVGGGSAMDCAKGVNLLLANGGQISDYRGDPSADTLQHRKPLLPLICVPTTAGTGSEAQSFALISDAVTSVKMACGDRRPPGVGLRPVLAVLDPDLTRSVPPAVRSAAGIDAVAHAVETSASRARCAESRRLSRAAWERLEPALPRVMRDAGDDDARADMLLGAHLAGAAIERSMLGAAHACANPLTAHFGVTHGVAVGILLPHVVRFNAAGPPADECDAAHPYADLDADADRLAHRLEALLDAARLPRRLRDAGVPAEALPRLAAEAAAQWTAGFNPRSAGPAELLTVLQKAW
ncbi:MAG: iron-containing alcohol dehydrogenase [Phycisphaerae bacterium]|nr:iron-containing alcohol dehydrogenase [Phycisphaerae bacterium]